MTQTVPCLYIIKKIILTTYTLGIYCMFGHGKISNIHFICMYFKVKERDIVSLYLCDGNLRNCFVYMYIKSYLIDIQLVLSAGREY